MMRAASAMLDSGVTVSKFNFGGFGDVHCAVAVNRQNGNVRAQAAHLRDDLGIARIVDVVQVDGDDKSQPAIFKRVISIRRATISPFEVLCSMASAQVPSAHRISDCVFSGDRISASLLRSHCAFFAGSVATTSASTIRRMRSSWPSVIGSKVPG